MTFKTQPMNHQLQALTFCGNKEHVALFMEQGTGKSKVVIDRAAALARSGLMRNLLVIAPNGVHKDWIREQAAMHWPDDVAYSAVAFRSGAPKKEKQKLDDLFICPATRLMTINFEAVRTKPVYDLLVKYIKSAPTMVVVDECSLIKTPGAKVTRCIQQLGKYAAFRMMLTGTEVTQGPLDLYAQFQFLQPGALGCPNFATFRARYAEWTQRTIVAGGNARKFEQLVRYTNLDELKQRVAQFAFQIRKKDCLDLPDKQYVKRSVVMGAEQRSVYDKVKSRVLAEFQFGTTTTANALVKLTRLAQITGGFLGTDEELGKTKALPNAKLASLKEVVDDIPDDAQVVIWARFVDELEAIAALLDKQGVAKYWGGISNRDELALEFKNGKRRFMIAQQRAGGKGHTWIAGTYVIYYSNNFSLEDRLQSEDRTHRIGQKEKVTYIDLIAEDSIDEKVHAALSSKKEMADYFKSPLEIFNV